MSGTSERPVPMALRQELWRRIWQRLLMPPADDTTKKESAAEKDR